jgi:amidase
VHEWIKRLPEPGALEERTRFAGRLGALLGGPPLALAKRAEPLLRRDVAAIFKRFDVVLTPTTAQLPPRVGESDGLSWWATSNKASAACPFAWAWNVLGWPALSVPAGFSRGGLPIGAQLLGGEGDEATLLALGAQLETVERWDDARPAPPMGLD